MAWGLVVEADLPPIKADRGQIEQVIMDVVLGMSDTGCGMTDDTRNHLFVPLFATKEAGRTLCARALENSGYVQDRARW